MPDPTGLKRKYSKFIGQFLLLLLILFSFFIGEGQTINPDSLRKVIAVQPDSKAKADNLNALAKCYLNTERDSLKKYAEYAFQVAGKVNNSKAMAQSDLLSGRYYSQIADFQKALYYNLRALRIADSINDTARIARASLNAGSNLNNLARCDDARIYFKKSLKAFLNLADSAGVIACYNNLGQTFTNKSGYDSAAFYFTRGLALAEKTQNKRYLENICYSLSEVYCQLGQVDQARKFARQSRDLYEANGDKSGYALCLNILGNIDKFAKDYQSAFTNYKKAEEVYSQLNDTLHLMDVYNNLGTIFLDQDKFAEAKKYLALALNGYKKLNYLKGIVVVMSNQAVILYKTGRPKEAIAINDSIIDMANRLELFDSRADALLNNSGIFLKMGDLRNAFAYQQRYYDLKDTIFNIDKEKLINDLSFKYEKEKDQAQILSLEKENLRKDLILKQRTIQRNAFIFTIISIIIFGCFMFLYINQLRKKDKIIAQHKIQQLEEEKKLLAAKALVEGQEEERKRIARELHDGLGVLLSATKMQFSSIRDTNPENLPLIQKATQLLEQATGDVRVISHNMMPGLLMKLGLYEAVGDLFDNLGDKGTLKVHCDIQEDLGRLPENQEIMLYRIVQEMVNNTLKHARAGNISLSIKATGETLELIYSDDGIGFDVDQMMEGKSLGLKSIRSRVDFLNGKMTVDSKPAQGTTYLIKLPANIL